METVIAIAGWALTGLMWFTVIGGTLSALNKHRPMMTNWVRGAALDGCLRFHFAPLFGGRGHVLLNQKNRQGGWVDAERQKSLIKRGAGWNIGHFFAGAGHGL
ncbi:MAG: hypothetical protein ACE5EM_07315 [Sphingomonadales bacterium]